MKPKDLAEFGKTLLPTSYLPEFFSVLNGAVPARPRHGVLGTAARMTHGRAQGRRGRLFRAGGNMRPARLFSGELFACGGTTSRQPESIIVPAATRAGIMAKPDKNRAEGEPKHDKATTVNFQALRRTYGTWAAPLAPLKDVQAGMRHASPDQTVKVYMREFSLMRSGMPMPEKVLRTKCKPGIAAARASISFKRSGWPNGRLRHSSRPAENAGLCVISPEALSLPGLS